MTPLPYKNVRYRFKTVSPKTRVRLAYVGKPGKVVEVTTYHRKNGWVKKHTRRRPRK